MQKSGIVALALVGALVLAGCIGVGVLLVSTAEDGQMKAAGTPARSSQVPSVSTDDVPDDLLEFYTQELDWTSCGDNECAELTVPINYQDPGAGSTTVAVERAAATGKRVGSLVVNPGGPGGSG